MAENASVEEIVDDFMELLESTSENFDIGCDYITPAILQAIQQFALHADRQMLLTDVFFLISQVAQSSPEDFNSIVNFWVKRGDAWNRLTRNM